MKKIAYLILTILAIIVVYFSWSEFQPSTEEDKNTIDERVAAGQAKDYYPFLKDTLLTYEGGGSEYDRQEFYWIFTEENTGQLSISSSGTEVAQLIKHKNDKVVRTYSQEEFYYMYKLDKDKKDREEIIIKEPLQVGNSWEVEAGVRKITAVDKEVKVPSGKYKALEVTTKYENSDGAKKVDYYTKNLGLIKTVYQGVDKNFRIETKLEEISKDVAKTYDIRFFYPNFHDENLVAHEYAIDFTTDDDIKDIFMDKLRYPPKEGLTRLISKNTTLNKLEFLADGAIKIDFSQELVSEMQAGHFLESMIIQGITNTFAEHYNTTQVYITLNGEAYQSGHIMLEEGEYFELDYELLSD